MLHVVLFEIFFTYVYFLKTGLNFDRANFSKSYIIYIIPIASSSLKQLGRQLSADIDPRPPAALFIELMQFGDVDGGAQLIFLVVEATAAGQYHLGYKFGHTTWEFRSEARGRRSLVWRARLFPPCPAVGGVAPYPRCDAEALRSLTPCSGCAGRRSS